MLGACLRFDAAVDRTGERLGVYAFLKTAEDQGNSDYQRMKGRYQHASTQAGDSQALTSGIASITPSSTAKSHGRSGRSPPIRTYNA